MTIDHNKVSRREHYIPQFYLKRFSRFRDGKNIFILDKTGKNIFSTSSKNICVEKDFYEVIRNPTHETSVEENIFSPQDLEFSKVYSFIEKTPQEYTKKERKILFEFVYFFRNRTSNAANKMVITRVKENDVENTSEIEEKKNIKQIGKIMMPFGQDINTDGKIRENPVFKNHMKKLAKYFIFHIKSKSESRFITSDDPVCHYNIDNTKGIKILFPITSQFCLMLTNDKKDKKKYPDQVIIDSDNYWVNRINKITYKRAERFVFGEENSDLTTFQSFI